MHGTKMQLAGVLHVVIFCSYKSVGSPLICGCEILGWCMAIQCHLCQRKCCTSEPGSKAVDDEGSPTITYLSARIDFCDF